MKRWPVVAVFAWLLAWGASPACALDHIKINYVEPAPYYAPLFLAIDKSYFAEDGVEAELAAQYDSSVGLLDSTGTTSLQNETVELKLRGELLGVPPAQLKKSADVFDFSFVQKAAAALKAENWQPRIRSN